MHEDPEAGRCQVQVEVAGAPHGRGKIWMSGKPGSPDPHLINQYSPFFWLQDCVQNGT